MATTNDNKDNKVTAHDIDDDNNGGCIPSIAPHDSVPLSILHHHQQNYQHDSTWNTRRRPLSPLSHHDRSSAPQQYPTTTSLPHHYSLPQH